MTLLNRISKLVSNSHQNFVKLFYDPRIPELALVGAHMKLPEIQRDENDLLDRSILWNTPKKRKTTGMYHICTSILVTKIIGL